MILKNLIVDLDDTISTTINSDYINAKPKKDVIEKLKIYSTKGFKITIFTSRNMRTYEGNIGKINIHTLPVIINWLEEHNVPYDEIILGKPWCGFEGFYVDDKAIRPREFREYSYERIIELLESDK